MSFKKAKVALVFDWMTNLGGAERVNLLLHKLFPEAPIYTSIYNPEKLKGFEDAKIHTSFIQKIPFSKNNHQLFLSMMPYAYESFDLSDYDIVISSSHSCAKGIITKPETMHVSYCHSPMRYAWDNWHKYIADYNMNSIIKRLALKKIHKIRLWDRLSADRVDYFIANSTISQKRIAKYYKRLSTVIYPSININKFSTAKSTKGYFLALGRLTSYKKFDLIVDVFNKIGLPLKIIGRGVDEKKLRAKAKPNIEFMGFVDENTLKTTISECEALIFPQIEDLGIVQLETMASGRPVIAYKEGGSLDTIEEGVNGILFNTQNEKGLITGIEKYNEIRDKFDPEKIRQTVSKFDDKVFEDKLFDFLETKWTNWQKKLS